MSDHNSQSGRDDQQRSSRGPWWSSASVLAPVVALIIGLVLGAVVVGAGQSSRSPEDAETVTVTPSPDATGNDTAVVVPQECVQAAETLEEATDRLREVVGAVRDFSRDRLVELLNELEDLEAQAREEAVACSEVDITAPTETSE